MKRSSIPAPICVDPDDLDKNPSSAPTFSTLIAQGLHRRHFLQGGVGAAALGLGLGLGSEPALAAATPAAPLRAARRPATALDFDAIGKSLADAVRIAQGYSATVLYATGDPLHPDVPAWRGDGSETDYDRRAGDHHDGMSFFGLNARKDARDPNSSQRGLLVVNHENVTGTAQFLHPAGETNNSAGALPRPESEVIKEQEAHGVSIVELRKTGGAFATLQASPYNRRITPRTVVDIHGPARGTAALRTRYSPTGTTARGTINNCAYGVTPWSTYLTCEENWAGYFKRNGGDEARRSERENAQLRRNGINPNSEGFAHRRWASVQARDSASTDFERWNCSVLAADATEDFRNEPNTFGYVVEIDPYAPQSRPRKRTAMGRRANEGCWGSLPEAGRPLAFYTGCDSRNEHVYKFVTATAWNVADGQRGGLDVGDKYLDKGTICVARFNADGSGRWLKLTLDNAEVAAGLPAGGRFPEGYRFEDLADICVNTRLAATAAGATRMDRPEWTAVNPFNGEIYITMTENPDRGNVNAYSNNNVRNPELDAANPRYWFDTKNASSQGNADGAPQRGNVHGHIVRIREDGNMADAETFRWDIFLFGAQAQADPGIDDLNYQRNVNLSGLSGFNDLSKPDGCWFSAATGILYIETDDNTYTDQTNCMLLAALPGSCGDGGAIDIVNKADGSPDAATRSAGADKVVRTQAGRKMSDATFKRLLVGPLGAEITGLTETPDGKTLFVNIQHPGENTGRAGSVALTPATPSGPFESNWPGNAGYGSGGATARPRSATLVITRDDGGVIGFDPLKRRKATKAG